MNYKIKYEKGSSKNIVVTESKHLKRQRRKDLNIGLLNIENTIDDEIKKLVDFMKNEN